MVTAGRSRLFVSRRDAFLVRLRPPRPSCFQNAPRGRRARMASSQTARSFATTGGGRACVALLWSLAFLPLASVWWRIPSSDFGGGNRCVMTYMRPTYLPVPLPRARRRRTRTGCICTGRTSMGVRGSPRRGSSRRSGSLPATEVPPRRPPCSCQATAGVTARCAAWRPRRLVWRTRDDARRRRPRQARRRARGPSLGRTPPRARSRGG